MRRLLARLLCLLLLTAPALGVSAAKQVPKAPTLSRRSVSILSGKTKTLKLNRNGMWKLVKTHWRSSKPSVVRVTQKGKLTGKKAGRAVITVTVKARASKKAKVKTHRLTCRVTVKPHQKGPKQSEKEPEHTDMKLSINGRELTAVWEDNESVTALKNLASEKPLTVSLSRYGGFEQVGALGRSLPRNDVQTTTAPGDIVLYSGNQIVVFYGSNSWAYTRLGRIQGLSGGELEELLGRADATLVLG